MFKDGICRVNDKLYNKTVQFYDINYQLAQNEDKTAIFENYCDFLNYFDSTINTVQLSFLNQVADVDEFNKQLEISEQDDDFNNIRREYTDMLKKSACKGQQRTCQDKIYHLSALRQSQSRRQNRSLNVLKPTLSVISRQWALRQNP